MWIVRLALTRPTTMVVAALLVLLGGLQTVRTTPRDIFPFVDIPAISVVWSYTGLPSQQMESQITQFSEFSLSGNVENVAKLESQTFDGVSVIRVFLQPNANLAMAMAQVTAISQTITRRMPPGTQPPAIVSYSATSVPILQLSFSSDTAPESELFDFVNNRVRTMLSVVRGTRFPLPTGGKLRQISVDVDLEALKAHGLAPQDVANAINAGNLILPTGSAKVGEREYRVSLNSSPEAIAGLNDLPIRKPDGRTVYVRDVAFVHDGFAVQTQIARHEGKRSVVLSVLKTGDASSLDVAERVKSMLPTIKATAPEGVKVELLADQSAFVVKAIEGLMEEGLIAAGLTALAILLFLGSTRSTLVVAASIPMSIACALIVMRALGQTLNVMTLGGFALAVGVLVDDATVELENVHRHLAMGKTLVRSILDGANEIAVPAFVASSSISIVFVSLLFLGEPVRSLFLPMGMAVAFSVMASYLLSRTLIPTLVRALLKDEDHSGRGPVAWAHGHVMAGFEVLRSRYLQALGWVLNHRAATIAVFVLALLGGAALVPQVGRDFFPLIDSGRVRLHVNAPVGTRIEETERVFSDVEAAIREVIPEEEREVILDQIGLPAGYSLSITDSSTVSSADGEVLIVLEEHRKHTTQEWVRTLRQELPRRFPGIGFSFEPADMVTQILNFGVPAPIDVQVTGMQRDLTYALARKIEAELRLVRGLVDVRVHQQLSAPRMHIDVDRLRANEAGLTQRDVANNLLLTVSNSSQVSPGYWVDPKTALSYAVAVQVPEVKVDSFDALKSLSLPGRNGPQLLGDLATFERRVTPVFATRINVQPTFDVRADIQDIDLGTAAASVEAVVAKYRKELPPGVNIAVRGQVESMNQGFLGLFIGLGIAALLVYALMVINFQSWIDPLVILFALPGGMVGIVLSLLATQTTFSIPSLMGALMSVGVATANSILLVTFANEQRHVGMGAFDAAMEAGRVRLRPVLMTALAMGIGMVPMALGLSEGGEQNASLARAVLGGLSGSTLATLFIVPVVYVLLRSRPVAAPDPELEAALHPATLQEVHS